MSTLVATDGKKFNCRGYTDGGAPTAGDFVPGDWVLAPDGIYLCYTGGAPGSWIGLGATVQVVDTELSALAALTAAADRLPYYTSASAAALATFTAFARTILDDATAGAVLTTLGVSAFVQTLLDDAAAVNARATLGAAAIPGSPVAFTQTYATADVTVPAATYAAPAVTGAALTDNSAGTANTTIEALPDPTDTPVTADALRDDLVAVFIPALRNNVADLVAAVNKNVADNVASTAQLAALAADVLVLKKLINSLIDGQQAAGIAT